MQLITSKAYIYLSIMSPRSTRERERPIRSCGHTYHSLYCADIRKVPGSSVLGLSDDSRLDIIIRRKHTNARNVHAFRCGISPVTFRFTSSFLLILA
ncbi:uncharacterized protein BT62DRAFT_1077409 [Guyanagaster necrorhizus]|uniref:Uncharacterized protein n=1 Tax=Guyanagaster necrorhizus TaxID=856835 RepID=A0A9P8AR29_9AGAR|nr:uncharacterized protein BT62DRAFT_1077409 [Guyanagaster necrorhizus MCA 3950]KAG7444620.1 hypothetical protein BT62DRAFT_1077409 [Guyanagaster necrorhizus MCA 3950]